MADTIQTSFEPFTRFDPNSILPQSSQNEDVEMTTDDGNRRIILAVDFGTTFSSVAYVQLSGLTQDTTRRLQQVKCITKYPGDRSAPRHGWQPREDTPTELWYSLGESAARKAPDDTAVGSTEDDSASDEDSPFHFGSEAPSESEGERDRQPEQRGEKPRNLGTKFWGFEVQLEMQRSYQPTDSMNRVIRFKLMLDEANVLTSTIRGAIKAAVRNLKKLKMIEKDTDIITDYLTQLLTHTKKELSKAPDFDDNIPIEFVLSIPAVWPSKACRIMQAAMATAAQRSGLGNPDGESLNNLFIVSEPEAAAACVLDVSSLRTRLCNLCSDI